jgi:hypothetical protein
LALAALIPLAAPSLAQDAPAPTDEELIASAEQGAHPSMSGPAQIVVWEDGEMRVLREGTNGWWCVPDNPASPAPDPFCGDANALPWWTALMEGQEAPPEGEVGLLYAGQGVQIASNTDPFATEPPEGQDWITFPPHQGTIGRAQDVAGMVASANPDTSKPVGVWMDTPYVHQRQPLDW